jgi:hypothetical protein
VAYQKKKRLARGLLEDLEQRVGGIRIEFIDRIDNTDSPALDGGGGAKEGDGFPRLINGNDGSHHALLVRRALKDEKTAMGSGRDVAGDRLGRIDVEVHGALNVWDRRIAMAEHKARHPIGERGLADALRSSDQPGMRDAAASVRLE